MAYLEAECGRRQQRGETSSAGGASLVSPEQPRSAVTPVVSAVSAVVASVLASVTPIVATVLPLLAEVTEKSRSIVSVSEQRHLQAPFPAAWRSASTAETSAWIGIRPLVTS
jgi:hypothetical protein